MADAALLGHGAFTLAMCGLMIAVQLVIYPQFRGIPPAAFPDHVAAHSSRIVAALALLAPLEVVFAAWVFLDPADGVSRRLAFLAGVLLFVGWAATALWYGPLHVRLQRGYDADLIERLIATNWARTALWLARGVLAIWMLQQALDHS